MPATYSVHQAVSGEWYWTLRASNGEVVATSEMYSTKEHAERGIQAAVRASGEASS